MNSPQQSRTLHHHQESNYMVQALGRVSPHGEGGEKKRRQQTQREESLSSSNLQVKTIFFLHLSGQPYFPPANSRSWRRNRIGFCFLWVCAIWNGTWAPDTAAGGPLSIRRQQYLANTSQLSGAGQPPGLLACWWWRTIVVSDVNSKCQYLGAYSNSAFYSQFIPRHWNTEQLKPWLYVVNGIRKGYLTTR